MSPPAEVTQGPLPRPVIIVGGYMDPMVGGTAIARWLRRTTGEQRLLAMHPGMIDTMDGGARQLVRTVERHFPSDDPEWTVPVDVIGISMGGLLARHAAAPGFDGPRRLNIRRLYTIAAPHTGAQAADLFGYVGTAVQMQSDSEFLLRLEERERRPEARPYPVVNYARQGDFMVGYGNTLPPHLRGELIVYRTAWYRPSHLLAWRDARIRADLLRRLRQGAAGAGESTGAGELAAVGFALAGEGSAEADGENAHQDHDQGEPAEEPDN